MGDFLNKAEYISQISEYDRDELIRYQDTVEEIEVKEEEVQAEYEELNTLQTKLVGQQTEVQKKIDEYPVGDRCECCCIGKGKRS